MSILESNVVMLSEKTKENIKIKTTVAIDETGDSSGKDHVGQRHDEGPPE